MDRIYKYNPDAIYKPNGGTYLQLITAKDLYIQNITVAEHNGHSDSFSKLSFQKFSQTICLVQLELRIKSSKIGTIINLLFGNRN